MSDPGESARVRPAKAATAFRTIGEVAGDLELPAHVLRFWESKFPQLKPLKRSGGRRYYRPEDVALLRRIRQCLYQDGYTIRGVRQLLGATDEGADDLTEAEPTLFRLDAGGSAIAADTPPTPAKPPRQPRRRQSPPAPDPEAKATLAEIRRDLLAARVLLDDLLRRRKAP